MIYSEMTDAEIAAYDAHLAETFGYNDEGEYIDLDYFGEDR